MRIVKYCDEYFRMLVILENWPYHMSCEIFLTWKVDWWLSSALWFACDFEFDFGLDGYEI